MLYKKNGSASLDKKLFENPTSEYRGTPFWAWNNLLTKEELCRQIDVFKEMGLGGFHMHVRTGLINHYLSDEYMQLVRDCVEKAKDNEMLAYLYDEDRWASGAAGGIVTENHAYRARHLLFRNTPVKKGEEVDTVIGDDRFDRCTLIAVYDVTLDADGYLAAYKRIGADETAQGQKWYAYLEISKPDSWFNDKTYVDTLNREAIEKFVEVTHERYLETVGDEFDKTVPSIFTDEPQFTRKRTFGKSVVTEDFETEMPWTDKVPELYKEQYGADILDTLPEIFWDLPASAPSLARYRYHDFIAELFASSFADTVGAWCDEHGIALTGHMMEEPTLRSQCHSLGEAMRSYRGFGLPGTDHLCNSHEFTTAKQAQSATHQYGKEGVLSELYGVTGWDADFRTYKHGGDWQAALGITVRVPHLSWYAMAGEAKRDYPASISYQSAWYKKYGIVEDHFARVNTALTRGRPVVKVGVIHPIESFWLHWGPNDKSGIFRENLDSRFLSLTEWLLKGSIDFDFIAESLLPSLCAEGSAPLQVGEMRYDTIIVPGCETLRSTTVERLKAFAEKGGRLVFMGSAPTLTDAVPSDAGKTLFDMAEQIEYSRAAVLTALDRDRTVAIRRSNGSLAEDLIYQLRQDNDCRWLFIAHADEPASRQLNFREDYDFIINGEYSAELYDTMTGKISPVAVTYVNGKTVIAQESYSYDSFLYRLTAGRSGVKAAKKTAAEISDRLVLGKVDYELGEKNVLMLDIAEFKLDGEAEFSPAEEILRLDNICRDRCGLRHRGGHVVQPWVIGNVPSVRRLTLRYTFESEIEYDSAELALEDAADAQIVFNGQELDNTILGNYVDISIFRVALPRIEKGANTLVITLPFGERTNAENVFILGDFGVRVDGAKATVTALPEKIPFGDLVHLGFPFYGGDITYKFPAAAKNGVLALRENFFYGACIEVLVDGERKGDIVYPPYELTVEGLADGEHEIGLKLYCNRYNSFGPVHLTNENESWHGPGAWRSDDDRWSYEYIFRRMGIIRQPQLSE